MAKRGKTAGRNAGERGGVERTEKQKKICPFLTVREYLCC